MLRLGSTYEEPGEGGEWDREHDSLFLPSLDPAAARGEQSCPLLLLWLCHQIHFFLFFLIQVLAVRVENFRQLCAARFGRKLLFFVLCAQVFCKIAEIS